MKQTVIVEDPVVTSARDEGQASGMMLALFAVIGILLVVGLIVWQPWATHTTTTSTIVQPPAVQQPAQTTVVNPPANNTTIVNPPAQSQGSSTTTTPPNGNP